MVGKKYQEDSDNDGNRRRVGKGGTSAEQLKMGNIHILCPEI